ncbi:MAG: peroxiredoxin [Bdellovibrionota bacterium]
MSESIEYGKSFSLKNEGGFTVLYFYPRDNTPGCTNEAVDFTKQLAKFRRFNARVVGVSQDSLASHERFREKHGLKVDLVSDPGGELCDKFGVIQMKSLYGKKFKGIVRSTFVLDAKGKVLREWTKVKVPGHVDEVLAFLQEQK